MSWKNDRAEMEMQAFGKKMMEEAAKRNTTSMKEVGKWKITMKGNDKHTKEEIESFMNQLVEFATNCDKGIPNIEVSIDPITEE